VYPNAVTVTLLLFKVLVINTASLKHFVVNVFGLYHLPVKFGVTREDFAGHQTQFREIIVRGACPAVKASPCVTKKVVNGVFGKQEATPKVTLH